MTKNFPWEYHSELTEERVVAVARMIVEGRQTAVELFDKRRLAGTEPVGRSAAARSGSAALAFFGRGWARHAWVGSALSTGPCS